MMISSPSRRARAAAVSSLLTPRAVGSLRITKPVFEVQQRGIFGSSNSSLEVSGRLNRTFSSDASVASSSIGGTNMKPVCFALASDMIPMTIMTPRLSAFSPVVPSSSATLNALLLSPPRSARSEVSVNRSPPKSVKFGADVKERVRPLPTNLRPLERMSRKSSSDKREYSEMISALQQWDLKWRVYLEAYYSDEMHFRFPERNEQVAQLVVKQKELDDLAGRCATFYNLSGFNQGNPIETVDAEHASISRFNEFKNNNFSSRVNSDALTCVGLTRSVQQRLALRDALHKDLLSRLMESIVSWRSIERKRWRNEISQSDFATFVSKIEVFEKKFKSVGDGVRRLQKKCDREADYLNMNRSALCRPQSSRTLRLPITAMVA